MSAKRLSKAQQKEIQTMADSFSLKIKARRLELGLTQRQVAERSKLSTHQVIRVETSRNTISLTTMVLLCTALEMNLKLLLDPIHSYELEE